MPSSYSSESEDDNRRDGEILFCQDDLSALQTPKPCSVRRQRPAQHLPGRAGRHGVEDRPGFPVHFQRQARKARPGHVPGERASLERIDYFSTTPTHRSQAKQARHASYLRCLRGTGVHAELARFKGKHVYCPRCGAYFVSHEERETDVAIGARLFEVCQSDEADTVVLMSGDTDLAPAVRPAPSAGRLFRVGPLGPPALRLRRWPIFGMEIGPPGLLGSKVAGSTCLDLWQSVWLGLAAFNHPAG